MHLPIRAKQLNGLNELWSCKPEWTITTHFASVLCTTAQESKAYVLVCSCCLKATDAQDTPCQRSGTSKKKNTTSWSDKGYRMLPTAKPTNRIQPVSVVGWSLTTHGAALRRSDQDLRAAMCLARLAST